MRVARKIAATHDGVVGKQPERTDITVRISVQGEVRVSADGNQSRRSQEIIGSTLVLKCDTTETQEDQTELWFRD